MKEKLKDVKLWLVALMCVAVIVVSLVLSRTGDDIVIVQDYGTEEEVFPGVSVMANKPVLNADGDVSVRITVKNDGKSSVSLSGFDVIHYRVFDIIEDDVEDFDATCMGEGLDEDCSGIGRLRSGEELTRVITFDTDEVGGSVEVGFYGEEYMKSVIFMHE